jgi:condensin-2 complex subunit G2
MKREEILSALENSTESFVELLRSKEEELDLSEFLQALSRKMQARVWAALLPLARDAASRLIDGENSSDEDTSSKKVEGGCDDVEVLSGVVTVCKCALTLESLNFTSELAETLQIIHDILLSVPEECCELQNAMSTVCEACWERGEEVEEREGLVPNCLLYLVARTFSQGATVKDVGRVWGMRGALLLLDFEDSSADSIKELLLSSLIEPLYLTSADGKKLLSYFFGLHPSFVDSLHQTIRNQIPWCPKAYLEVYGEVYFKSWRLASGPYLKKLEDQCVQDLMYTAVHASRSGPHAAFPALRKVLGYIHQQTQHSGVSEMILRLYNPFLWRSLKVANSHVRANAVCLMLDAFPLHDPCSTREEIDSLLQKQFDLMSVSPPPYPSLLCITNLYRATVYMFIQEFRPNSLNH